MTIEILPDARAKSGAGGIYNPTFGWMVPVYCINCGVQGGDVPAETTTSVFWQCTPCHEKHGAIPGLHMTTDAAFHAKVAEAQLNEFGRYLTPLEVAQKVESADTAFAKLLLRR